MKVYLLTLFLLLNMTIKAQNNFKNTQLQFEGVAKAYQDKWEILEKFVKSGGFGNQFNLLINAYKAEGKLEVWLKSKTDSTFSLFRTYNFCAHSGTLGPKIMEGDKQTPEGFYFINVFNPLSKFYLSLGINYPNAVDLVRTGKNQNPGSDIYIHGKCETVGCIPLTDEKIKEVYILAVEARNSGQDKIQVNIFPFKMTKDNFTRYTKIYPSQLNFWKNLQPAYLAFEKDKKQLNVAEIDGKYVIK